MIPDDGHLLSGVRARRLAEERLREEITRGVVVPGQRLVEPELAERYGVTRNSARLALDALIGEGLVERIPNRGARVRVVPTSEVVAILECRQVLDGMLARQAAQHATAGDLAGLRENLARMGRAVADRELLEFATLVQEHSRLLTAAARHPLAASLVDRLAGQVARHHFQLLLLRPGRAQAQLTELTRVVEALAEGAADAAESAARAHLQAVVGALLGPPAGEPPPGP
ncbi:GntR family transcriptional regulator [Blastococcus xanthinilyticus]|uniref:GntR family transcriptional regulator n=1 Tax=Blastococcus xanthinilyticus TaxID=1564164 RepID=A0A5S5D0C9_9ACTN|nr:GntR family transcriptional regulator [Blastococcus xanthinilyticus]TYP89195.1 GntR family transcriptional regulator [Blastococcus xanthinilyticus]